MTILRVGLGCALALVIGLLGACGEQTACGPGTTFVDGVCLPDDGACGPNTTYDPTSGQCIADPGATCATGTVLQDGACVPDGSVICETGTVYDSATGKCVADISGCGTGTILVGGECVPDTTPIPADVVEAAEPNDATGAGAFVLPAVGGDLTIKGCVTPHDLDGDGQSEPDLDPFVFTAAGPTLLDVTVAGTGGATGGFQIQPRDAQLTADGWARVGVNLVSATSQQQVFLPKAGDYVLTLTDGRSLVTGAAAGGTGTCYYATVVNAQIPTATPLVEATAATGVLGGATQFWSYTPLADGALADASLTAPSPAAAGGVVVMVGGAYRASTRFGSFGGAADRLLGGLAPSDDVIVVVEPLINFAVDPVATALTVTDQGAVADPGDGSPVNLTHDAARPAHFLSFQGQAGDLVRLQLDPAGVNFDVLLFPGDGVGGPFIADLCFSCGAIDQWVQLQHTGTYYERVIDLDAADGDAYDVAFTRTARTPATLAVGGTAAADLATDDRGWFTITTSGQDWLDLGLTPTSFTTGRARLYRKDAEGAIDAIVPAIDDATFTETSPLGRIVRFDAGTFLLSVDDATGHVGDESFDLALDPHPFTDLGLVNPGTPVAVTDLAVDAGASHDLLIGGGADEFVRFSVNAVGGLDPVVRVLDRRQQTVLGPIDGTGAGGSETFGAFIGPELFLALEVTDGGGAAGSFDVSATGTAPALTAATDTPIAIPDNTPAGIDSSIAIASPCTIAAVTVQVDVTHTFIGDVTLTLTSAAGTPIQLKGSDFDATDDLHGTYPITLTPVDPLALVAGEEAAGTWTLHAVDTAAADVGTLDGWQLGLVCE